MPLDTSIPLQVKAPQFQDFSQVAAEQQMNALRGQLLQQQMQQNALTMQNTMEDRRRAEANRAVAARQAAEEKALKARILQESGGDAKKASTIALSLGRPDIAESYAKGRESVAKAGAEEVELEKQAFANAYQRNAAYAPLIANGAVPGRAVVAAIFDDPVMGGVLSRVMTRDQAIAYADQDPQGLAQILATPPDKIYESVVTSSQAKPTEVDLGGKKSFVDTNPQSATYMQPVGEFDKIAPAANVTDLKKGERWNPEKQRVEAVPGSDIYVEQSQKHGKDISAVKTVEESTKSVTQTIDKILDPAKAAAFNSNFGGSTYLGSRYIPGETQDVGAAIETLKSQMKMAGASLVRARGGAVGAITEREWPYLESMIDTLTPNMTENEARRVIQSVGERLKALNDISKETYDTTWGNTQYYKPSASGAKSNSGANAKSVFDAADAILGGK